MGSCVACQQQAAAILRRYEAFIFINLSSYIVFFLLLGGIDGLTAVPGGAWGGGGQRLIS